MFLYFESLFEFMILNIPFYKNDRDGEQCYQVAMQSVLKHFLGKDFSLEELDKLTLRKFGKWTFTCQIVPVLQELGLKLKFYSDDELEPMLRGEPHIREILGKDADSRMKFVDVPAVVETARRTLEYKLFEKKQLSFQEIEEHIRQDHVPLILFDYRIFSGKDHYQGHFCVVTGFDDSKVYYHESGPLDPEPNKKVDKQKFIQAWYAEGTGSDVVIVYGKR